jgi:hypothetical protein
MGRTEGFTVGKTARVTVGLTVEWTAVPTTR